MSLSQALSRDNLLRYKMNQTLPTLHGFSLRLIAPAWYGVANVKWLTRIEVVDHRHAGRFMARDYVSIPEQERDGQTVWTFNTVGHARLKSAPAKVTRRRGRYAVMGAAWGAQIARVEIQIDDRPWRATRLDAPPLLAETEVQTDGKGRVTGSCHRGESAATHGDLALRLVDARTGRELSKGEASHDLSRFLCFGKEGVWRGREFGDQVHTFSCLSVLHNAVVAWNMLQIGEIVTQLRAEGHQIDDETLSDVTPLVRRHINPFGRYHFDLDRMRQDADRGSSHTP